MIEVKTKHRCKKCGRPVLWVKRDDGRAMAVDAACCHLYAVAGDFQNGSCARLNSYGHPPHRCGTYDEGESPETPQEAPERIGCDTSPTTTISTYSYDTIMHWERGMPLYLDGNVWGHSGRRVPGATVARAPTADDCSLGIEIANDDLAGLLTATLLRIEEDEGKA